MRILAGVCAGLLLIAGLLWWRLDATLQRAAVAEGQVGGYVLALQERNEQVTRYENDLVQRELELQASNKRAAHWSARWKEALHAKPVADWAAVRLPAAVAQRVRELSGTGEDRAADEGPPADPHAGP